MVYQIVQGHRDRATLHIGCPVAEDLRSYRPVIDFLGGRRDLVGAQIVEALIAGVNALPAGHGVMGIDALIQLVAGEHIQVSPLQMDAVGKKLFKITAHIVQGL